MTLAYMMKERRLLGEPARIHVLVVGQRDSFHRPLFEDYVYVCEEGDCDCDPWDGAESIAQAMVEAWGFKFVQEDPFCEGHCERIKALEN